MSFSAKSQVENTLFHMPSLPQSAHYNPGKFLDYNVAITLPGLSGGNFFASNSGFSFNDVFRFESDRTVFLPEGLSDAAIKNNTFAVGARANLFGVYIRTKKMGFNFRVEENMEARFSYPKDLVDLIVKGNGHSDYLGKTLEISPKAFAMHTREFSLGVTREINEKLNVGATFRLLFGLGHFDAEGVKFNLTTENRDNYPITISAEGEILSSGFTILLDSALGEQIDDETSEYLTNTDNKGFAIDLGATYQLNEKIQIEASVLNLGSIKWKSYAKKYDITGNAKPYTFTGIDILDVFRDDESGSGTSLEEVGDSLETALNYDAIKEGVDIDSYTSGLPVQVNIGGRYKLKERLYVNALMNGRFYAEEFVPSFSLGATKDLGRIATIATSYNIMKNSINNIGFGFSLNTPFQIHLVSDNLITAALFPKSAQNLNVRFGINMVFGNHEKRMEKEEKGGKNKEKRKKSPSIKNKKKG
ncbi:MAG: hypothetical protein ACI85I_002362 [Arenicella sp.]